jgi:Bacterial Ig domain
MPCPPTSSPAATAASRRHPRRRLVTVGAALAALTLLGAACSDDDDTVAGEPAAETGGDSGGGGGGDGDLTVSIADPADGATVEPGFKVEIDPSVDIGEPDTGLHHVHLYYDGNRSDGEYDIVYSADEPWTVDRDLTAGDHTIEAVVANADHSLTDASDQITVTVGEGAGTGGSDTTDSGGDYGY